MKQGIENIIRATSADDLWDAVMAELANYGVTSLFYGVLASMREAEAHGLSKSVLWRSNHPQSYFDVYKPIRLLETDLSALRAVYSFEPTFWHDAGHWEDQEPEVQKRSRIEDELGFAVGFSMPLALPTHGGVISGAGICAGELKAVEFDRMWCDKGTHLQSVLSLLDVGMRKQHFTSFVGLTKREKDCLSWLAAGLRPDQIAEKLGIGYRSVDKYINAAKHKLKAATRDQAVARALIFQVIQP